MKRKPIIAANWKMNLNFSEAVSLTDNIVKNMTSISAIDMLLFPSALYIKVVADIIKGSNIGLGGQNICFERSGAFTGEISAAQLKDMGCTHTLIGHSERRHYFHEDYEMVNKKIHMALASHLDVILCVGESLEEKNQELTEMVVCDQISSALSNVSIEQISNIYIAYEPIWSIGTGETAAPEGINSVHQTIRDTLSKIFHSDVGNNMHILYGGSVNADNVKSFLEQNSIDGVLVGGASIDYGAFFSLVNASLDFINKDG